MSEYLAWGFGLFGIAFLLFVVEIVVPTGGLLGLLAFCVALAGVVAFWLEGWGWGVSSLGFLIAATPLAIYFAITILPHTPFGKALILGGGDDDERREAEKLTAAREAAAVAEALLGAEGVVDRDLRPIGVVVIDGVRREAISEHGVVDAGTRVRVTRVDGHEIRVRAV